MSTPGGVEREHSAEGLLADLLADVLGKLKAGASIDIEEICVQHPGLAAELRDMLPPMLAMAGLGGRRAELKTPGEAPSSAAGSPPPPGDVDLPPPAGTKPAAGRILGGYRIVREIGRGGMGIVYEGVQESLGRRVALKVLPGDFALDPRRVERFHREARAAARIRHPCVVDVYEVGEDGETHFYAMEYIEGSSLDRVLAEARRRSPPLARRKSSASSDPGQVAQVVEKFAELADGLEEAHRLGLIHRDVKPSNILVASRQGGGAARERYVLVDFGLVHEAEAKALTRSGERVGTLSYMSPEQVARRAVDSRTDVYSLGATLYETLTLSTPCQGESEHDLQRAILFDEPLPPRRLNPRLHRDLETIVLHALEKSPERRYASAAELAADLRRFLKYEPILARPTSVLGSLVRRAGKHRWKLGAAAAILLLLATVGLMGWSQHRRERLQRAAEYEPRVRQAAMRMQLAGLGMSGSSGYLAKIASTTLLLRGEFQVLSLEVGRRAVEGALTDLARAEEDLPGRPDAYYHRSRGLLLLGREAEARKEIDRALELDPGCIPAQIIRETLEAGAGGVVRAAANLGGAGGKNLSGWGEAWVAARQAIAARRWEDAANAYGRLIELVRGAREPYVGSLEEALIGRGVARFELDDFRDSIEDLLEATTRMPDSADAALLLGTVNLYLLRKAKAEVVFREAFDRVALKDDFALEVAGVYFTQGDYERVLAWIERLPPGSAVRERNRSFCLTNLGRVDEAIRAAREAIRIDPADAFALSSLVWVLVHTGDHRGARTAALEAIRLNSRNAYLLFLAGIGFHDEPERKIALFREALALDPRMPWAHNWLGRELYRLGKKEEAFLEVRRSIEIEPKAATWHGALARMLESEGRAAEAVQSYCRSIELEPYASTDHHNLRHLLRHRHRSTLIAASLERLVENFEKLIHSGAEDACVLLDETVALALIYNPQDLEPARALRHARRAVEASGGKDPEALSVLAEVRFSTGERREAVLTLEHALRLTRLLGASRMENRWYQAQLEAYRVALRPCLPSYGSIDAALLEILPDEPRDLELLEASRAASEEGNEAGLLAYFEGRVLERARRYTEAAARFREVIALDPDFDEPRLRLDECLRAAGDPDAEDPLPLLVNRSPDDGEFWDLWAGIQLLDLARPPASVLADLPATELMSGFPADLRWLLESLAAGQALRIHCGGKEHGANDGRLWREDCFYYGGQEVFDDLHNQSMRWFQRETLARYRLPLPAGRYRITLHLANLAEVLSQDQGHRRFGVRIGGKEAVSDHEPMAHDFAAADCRTFEATISGAFLDIDFMQGVENPTVAGIEVESLP